jgi:membrane protease YdiL (CAAX protease family)
MFSHENLRFSLAILWSVVGFGGYYYLSQRIPVKSRFTNLSSVLEKQGNLVLMRRMLGVLILGGGTLMIILLLPGPGLYEYGISFMFLSAPPWWSLLLIPLIPILSFASSRAPANLKHYPQIRAREWTPSMLALSSGSWILFLIAYELFFRGFLLHAFLEQMDPGPAIALNTALYVFAHFYKGRAEIFGAIPVGIVFCYVTLATGNFWTAAILHTLMALSNEWFSIRAHPEMTIMKSA